jgi:hypothetical protein
MVRWLRFPNLDVTASRLQLICFVELFVSRVSLPDSVRHDREPWVIHRTILLRAA